MVRSIIKKGKNWGNIPFLDILLGDFDIKVFGSRVFSALWKDWKDIKPLLCFRSAIGRNPFFAITDGSLWWGVYLNDKPLALTQCCSAKSWNKKGISYINDIIVDNRMYSWAELSNKFDLPASQKKTYTLLAKAVGNWFPSKCISSCHNSEYIKWKDGTPIMNFSCKKIYNLMNDSDKNFNEVN